MADLGGYFDTLDATWPAEEKITLGPLTLRRSNGGGKRVRAATASGPVGADDVAVAEARMRDLDQPPLFQIRPGDDVLDQLLESQGYGVIDPTLVYTCPVAHLAQEETDREQASLAVWEPLAIQLDFWRAGGVGPDRIAVMERVTGPKTALIGRHDNSPGGTCFVAVHEGMAMLHALEIIPAARRVGMGRAMTVQAAQWAAREGAETFALLCVQANGPANALYSKLGMQVAGQYHYRIKES
jgi:GNAT superfamily N-acetyltransferase